MGRILCCIWGQLRGLDTCLPSQQENVFGPSVDLLLCLNTPTDADVPNVRQRCEAYGPTVDTHVYSCSISQVRDEIGVHVKFYPKLSVRDLSMTRKVLRDGRIFTELTDGYRDLGDRNGKSLSNAFADGCILALYNFDVLRQRLRSVDMSLYSHVVIMRSDLLFLHPLVDPSTLDPTRIYTYKGLGNGSWWGGYFSLLFIVPMQLHVPFLRASGTAIFRLADCRWRNNPRRRMQLPGDAIGMNAEKTLYDALKTVGLRFGFIDVNPFFVSYDVGDKNISTWSTPIVSPEGHRFKYEDLYNDAQSTAGGRLVYQPQGPVIRVQHIPARETASS